MRGPIDYFDSEALRSDLSGKTVRGGVFTAASQAISIAISFATIPVLARLLAPEDFGLVAMVTVFTNFAAMFVNAGLSMATVQRDKINRFQVSNLFWIATFLGALIAALVAALAPAVSWFYEEPRLTPITLALACSFLFSGLTVQHLALLRRGMQFQSIAIITTLSRIVGEVAAIAWAWMHYGQSTDYWALVLIPLVTAGCLFVGTWLACPWRPNLPRRRVGTRDLVIFGANITGFNFMNYFARNSDNLLIGWWWGATNLGYYGAAYKILLFPAQQATKTLSTVVVPALSRLRSSPDRYRQAYLSAVRALAWLSIPLVGLLFCTSRPLILLYLGADWEPVVHVFRALVPAAWATSFICCSGWVYASWGHVNRQLKWGLAHSFTLLVIMGACLPFGMIPLAYGISAGYVLLRIPGFYICYLGTPLRLTDLWQVIWRPTLIVFLASVAGLYSGTLLPQSESTTSLASAFAANAAIYTGTIGLLVPIVPAYGVYTDIILSQAESTISLVRAFATIAVIYVATICLLIPIVPGCRKEWKSLFHLLRSNLKFPTTKKYRSKATPE